MPWKETSLEKIAKKLNVNLSEVQKKQQLIEEIYETRKKKKITQKLLADKVGVSQSRIAQIESGIGTINVSFDVLFNILHALGRNFEIKTYSLSTKKVPFTPALKAAKTKPVTTEIAR